jgi:TPR repeat protein
MISGGAMPMASLRALADYGDGLAAFRYARLLETMPETNPASIAHYYAIAAYTGRDFAVPPLARLLAKSGESFSASVLKQGLNAMTVQVLSGNSVAASLLGEMYANGTPFGRDLAKAQDLLASNGGTDGPKAALRLGTTLFSDPDDAASGHIGARAALGIAAAGDDLAARVTAENLLRLLDAAPPTDAKATP